ncbi:gamma-glutamylcyclotransferase [Vibrio sp. ZSDE26]|uniref:Gamma-glutamylcyclotransferase n=1 Tax=Vibrio amylolyticus TaxID=2847292 RepID=A0A9X1XIY7_9VIBR|nr:gamma-glutamylcyclotransferase family protein [Vibrio amylolyticus]MCK6262498.1 gamma-glutamylcyclotransferase [Vibrio amylolyticus]
MYIFGYGSLMNSASRRLTGQTGTTIPVNVRGLVRYWGKIDDSYVLSPLVVNEGEGQVNGVLLKIDEHTLEDFDRRERGYHRIKINALQVEVDYSRANGTILKDDAVIWVYVKNEPEPPCTLSPIMQSYVDTVLAGCLEVSESFAENFIENTVGWNFPFENDRDAPKYGNVAGVEPEHHTAIDSLLATVR